MVTDYTEARVSGLTVPWHGSYAMVITDLVILSQSHGRCFYEPRNLAPGPSDLTRTITMVSGYFGQEPQQHRTAVQNPDPAEA